MKTCTKCGETKPLGEFSKSSRSKDGLQWRCKGCSNAAGVTRRAGYREQFEAGVVVVPLEKVCPTCKETKPSSEFHKNKSSPDGLQTGCKGCRPKRRHSTVAHNGHLKRKYGLTREEYDDMLERQGGACAICQQMCTAGRRLAVDHSHDTKKVRGILCSRCNTSIGSFNDDPALLQRAIDYLLKYRKVDE